MCVLQEVVKVAIVVRVAVAVIQIQLKFYQLHLAQANNKIYKIKPVRKSDGIHSEVQNVCIAPNRFKQTNKNSTSFLFSLTPNTAKRQSNVENVNHSGCKITFRAQQFYSSFNKM